MYVVLSKIWVLFWPDTEKKSEASQSIVFTVILGFHSRDEAAMLVYKTMAKCRSSFAYSPIVKYTIRATLTSRENRQFFISSTQ